MTSLSSIEINLDHIESGLRLWIDSRKPDTLFDEEETAVQFNEARFQLKEGCFYDYQLSSSRYNLGDPFDNIVIQHKRTKHLGTISPNVYVGTLEIPLICTRTDQKIAGIYLEVKSVKTNYRHEYHDMLEFITEKCTDLLLQANSPVSHFFEIDFTKDSQTLYQRFAFIKSIIGTDEFAEAIHRIVTMPVTKWTENQESIDIRNAKRFSNANIKELLRGGNRTKLEDNNYLIAFGIETLPKRITTTRKTDSVDTPENRFIKHALETFLKFLVEINKAANDFNHRKLLNESEQLIQVLEGQLHYSIFKEISRPTTLKLNSPVLQKKEGYREVLRVWLMFDLAAKLIWQGGEDVYGAGKKDIATLYEYWLFFKLLDLFQEIFDIEPEDITNLIQPTTDGLSLKIKQGKYTPLKGVFNSQSRKLNVRFNYNRSFIGKNLYPSAGSWSTTLRPDYTLSLWPYGIVEEDAEIQELIVHIHFDAKYKIANILEYLKTDDDLDLEKKQNRMGIYKNADLLKMHTYKDAIRRTGGAYVLYPGEIPLKKKGFHEIIPGLGAFPVRPSKTDTGIGELKKFIHDVIEHFIDRTSQREKLAYRVFDIHKDIPSPAKILFDPLPETYNKSRDLIPDETFVLVGFYKSLEHFEWIRKKKLYNFRLGSGPGSIILDQETISAKYLLLHTYGDIATGNLWKIVSKAPSLYSKKELEGKGYPSASQDNYLVVKIKELDEPELLNIKWAFKNLKNYTPRRASSFPFTCSLLELMSNKIK